MRTPALIAFFAVLGFGCGRKDDRRGSIVGEPATGSGVATAPVVDLAKLGLEIEVDGKIDMEIDDGYWLVVEGESPFVVKRGKAQTIADVKSLDAMICKAQNAAETTLPDGWTLTFTCAAIDPAVQGIEYWVHVHRTIDGKPIECSVSGVHHESTARAALAACRTLRPRRTAR